MGAPQLVQNTCGGPGGGTTGGGGGETGGGGGGGGAAPNPGRVAKGEAGGGCAPVADSTTVAAPAPDSGSPGASDRSRIWVAAVAIDGGGDGIGSSSPGRRTVAPSAAVVSMAVPAAIAETTSAPQRVQKRARSGRVAPQFSHVIRPTPGEDRSRSLPEVCTKRRDRSVPTGGPDGANSVNTGSKGVWGRPLRP